MNDKFKSLFNAEAEKADQQAADAAKSIHEFTEQATREYPRLCKELLDLTRKAFDGVKGVTIDSREVDQRIDSSSGKNAQSAATVKVPVWSVTFNSRQMNFRPEGTGYLGVCGKIAVETSGPNPFFKEAIFAVTDRTDKSKWVLATFDKQHRATRLTQDALEKAFEQVFIGKQTV